MLIISPNIAHWNQRILQIYLHDGRRQDYDERVTAINEAIERVVREADLQQVATDELDAADPESGSGAVLYRAEDGTVASCLFGRGGSYTDDDELLGLGFYDDIEWYVRQQQRGKEVVEEEEASARRLGALFDEMNEPKNL